MNYDGNDLGYDLGYDLQGISVELETQREFSTSEEIPSLSYLMGPPGVVQTGAKNITFPGLLVTADPGKKGEPGPDKSKPKVDPAQLRKVEQRQDRPFFYEHTKGTQPEFKAGEGEKRAILEKNGLKSPYEQRAALDLLKGIDQKDIKEIIGVDKPLKDLSPEETRQLLGKRLGYRYYRALRSKGYSDAAIQDFMVTKGLVSADSKLFPKRSKDITLPKKGGGASDKDKLGTTDIARNYNQLSHITDKKFPGNTKRDEKDAYLKNLTLMHEGFEKYVKFNTTELEPPRSRADCEQDWHNLGLMKEGVINADVKAEEGLKKVFSPGEGQSDIFSRATGFRPLMDPAAKVRVPDDSVELKTYQDKSPAERAKFRLKDPVTAAKLDGQLRGKNEKGVMGLMTSDHPAGLNLSEHEAKGMLASDAFGDPPLYDVNGRMRTAQEMGISQEAYEDRVQKLKQELKDARQDQLGEYWAFDKNGEPVKNEEGPGYQLKDGLETKEQRDDAKAAMMAKQKDWRWEKREKAIKYARGQVVAEELRLGLKPDDIGKHNISKGFYGEEPDPIAMLKYRDELKKIPTKKGRATTESKAWKKKIETENKDIKIPPDTYQSDVHETISSELDAKGGKKGKGAGGSNMALEENRQRHQRSERRAQQRFKKWELKESERLQKEMKALDVANQEKMAKFNAEIQKEAAGRQFVQQMGSSLFQGALQMNAQMMEAAHRRTDAMLAATNQYLNATMPRAFDIYLAMIGGGGRRG